MLHSRSLAERIESAQVQNQRDYADTYSALKHSEECVFMQVGKAGALFAGADSPLTQSFGLGLGEEMQQPEAQSRAIDTLEEFFFAYNVPVNIELANLTPLDLTILLGRRGYTVCEYSHVLGFDLSLLEGPLSAIPDNGNIAHRATQSEYREYIAESGQIQALPVKTKELESVAEAIAAGFLEHNVGEKEIPTDFQELFVISMQTAGSTAFAVTIDGEIAGAGGLTLVNGVAMLSGASTQPKFRNRGVQKALIHERLHYARYAGCDVAVVSTAPGSVSQENMQKYGFQILYARTKFTRSSQSLPDNSSIS